MELTSSVCVQKPLEDFTAEIKIFLEMFIFRTITYSSLQTVSSFV